MSKVAKARIAYTGPALDQGVMDVRDLAPSLLAFADLVNDVNKAIGGEQKIQVLLNQDSLQRGSFDITTILQCSILEQAKLFMSMADENGLTAVMDILGWGAQGAGTAGGIFSLIKWIRGRKIKDAESKENKFILHLDEGEVIVTTNNIMKVYLNADCRRSIEKVLTPLHSEGIESFELRNPDCPQNKEAIESIAKADAHYFKAPPVESIEQEENLPEQEITVKITSITFEKGNKWRLTDGNNTFWAKIEDEEFLSKVEQGNISFTNGDMLRIRYYIRQKTKDDSLSSEYIVTKVLELKKRPEQIKLDFDIKID